MNRVAQNGYPTEDIADDLATVHETADPDAIDSDALKPAIAFALDTDAEITIHDVTPTENSARPSSILMVDLTVGEESFVAEIQCTDEMNVTDDDAVDYNDDGTMSIPVSAIGDPTNNYETIDVIVYEG